MADRTNRRDEILDSARTLFINQGYETTSVRQIAEQVGCTEAALYYHFPGGKRALFGEVLETNLPSWVNLITACGEAETLEEFIRGVGHLLITEANTAKLNHLRWLMTEYPTLSDEEKEHVHYKQSLFRHALIERIMRYVPDRREAEHIMWTIMFTLFGYTGLMVNLDVKSEVSFDEDAFIDSLAARLAHGATAIKPEP